MSGPGTVPLGITFDLSEEDKAPYFLWDEPTSIRDLKRILREGPEEERVRLTAKILREARYADVWRFLTLKDLEARWKEMPHRLGRQQALWEFLVSTWRRNGLLA